MQRPLLHTEARLNKKKLLINIDFDRKSGKYNYQKQLFDFVRVNIKYKAGCTVHTDASTVVNNIVETYRYYGMINWIFMKLNRQYLTPYTVANKIMDFVGDSYCKQICINCMSYVSYVEPSRMYFEIMVPVDMEVISDDKLSDFFVMQAPKKHYLDSIVICELDNKFNCSYKSNGVDYKMLNGQLLQFVPSSRHPLELESVIVDTDNNKKQIVNSEQHSTITYSGPKIQPHKWRMTKKVSKRPRKNRKNRAKERDDKLIHNREITLDESENIDIGLLRQEEDEEDYRRYLEYEEHKSLCRRGYGYDYDYGYDDDSYYY